MKRTTLALDNDLLRQLKADAARRGTTLGQLANELLRSAIAKRPQQQKYELQLAGWEAELQPGVDLLDRDKLFDLMSGR